MSETKLIIKFRSIGNTEIQPDAPPMSIGMNIEIDRLPDDIFRMLPHQDSTLYWSNLFKSYQYAGNNTTYPYKKDRGVTTDGTAIIATYWYDAASHIPVVPPPPPYISIIGFLDNACLPDVIITSVTPRKAWIRNSNAVYVDTSDVVITVRNSIGSGIGAKQFTMWNRLNASWEYDGATLKAQQGQAGFDVACYGNVSEEVLVTWPGSGEFDIPEGKNKPQRSWTPEEMEKLYRLKEIFEALADLKKLPIEPVPEPDPCPTKPDPKPRPHLVDVNNVLKIIKEFDKRAKGLTTISTELKKRFPNSK